MLQEAGARRRDADERHRRLRVLDRLLTRRRPSAGKVHVVAQILQRHRLRVDLRTELTVAHHNVRRTRLLPGLPQRRALLLQPRIVRVRHEVLAVGGAHLHRHRVVHVQVLARFVPRRRRLMVGLERRLRRRFVRELHVGWLPLLHGPRSARCDVVRHERLLCCGTELGDAFRHRKAGVLRLDRLALQCTRGSQIELEIRVRGRLLRNFDARVHRDRRSLRLVWFPHSDGVRRDKCGRV
mmetsp:Transcript_35044/g.83530  ORF Transcript_35044/g.83530 Transcript_35044/m.83530 type:complete len:239 (-) Transcript_35044:887-1603(-)